MGLILLEEYDGKLYRGHSLKAYIGKNVEGFALYFDGKIVVYHSEGKKFIACSLDYLAERYGVERVAASWSSKPRGNNKKQNALYKLGGVKLIYIDRNPDALCEKLARVIPIISNEECSKYAIEFSVTHNDCRESKMKYSYATIEEAKEFTACRVETNKIEEEIKKTGLSGEERKALVSVRINQGEFRKKLLAKYRVCQICGVTNEHLLIASHIKPWAACGENELEERLDINNGLLLCPNHDKLFDKGYISFNDEGEIIISSRVSKLDITKMNISSDVKINMTEGNKYYMQFHRTIHEL